MSLKFVQTIKESGTLVENINPVKEEAPVVQLYEKKVIQIGQPPKRNVAMKNTAASFLSDRTTRRSVSSTTSSTPVAIKKIDMIDDSDNDEHIMVHYEDDCSDSRKNLFDVIGGSLFFKQFLSILHLINLAKRGICGEYLFFLFWERGCMQESSQSIYDIVY